MIGHIVKMEIYNKIIVMTTMTDIDIYLNIIASKYNFEIGGHAISLCNREEDEIYIIRICSLENKNITLYFLKDQDYGIVFKAGGYYHNGTKEILDEIIKELKDFL